MRAKVFLSFALSLVIASSVASPTVEAARVKKKESCSVQAERHSKNEMRKRIFKTALMGGTTAIVIGAVMSANNKDGRVMAKGAFGGGQIGGKAGKMRMKQDYNQALSACRRGVKI